MMKNERQSNIELLRIISMLGVIVLHYNNPDIGGALILATGINKGILFLLESIFICAVNLYMLISGYFLCTKDTRKLTRPLELLLQVILFQFGFYVYGILVNQGTFSLRGVIKSLIPNNYFAVLYIVCFIISPYINVLLTKIGQKQSSQFLAILLLIFSIWPVAVDLLKEATHQDWMGLSSIGIGGSQNGYTIINFMLMYCIGAYLRLYMKKDYSYITLFSSLGIVVVVICSWAVLNTRRVILGGTAWGYCNPFVIAEAVIMFLIFHKMQMKNSRIINTLSKGTFTVYLLHIPLLAHARIPYFVQKSPGIMVVHIFLAAVVIYLICFVCYVVYEMLTRPLIRLIEKKWMITLKVEV